MVRQSRTDLDDVFMALADPTRRAILARLAQGEACVGELAAPHNMSFAAISRHVRVLEGAGLMHRTRQGRNIMCRFDGARLNEATGWLQHYTGLWEQKLDALGDFLEDRT